MGDQQQDPLQEPPNNQKNGDDAPSETTAQLYYYQNPTTGSVSNTPLLLPQLVKLLVPVREGMSSILPPHTQCLAVRPSLSTVNEEEEEEDDPEQQQQQQQQQFGEWKPVSSVNVLKEAACSQWFLTGGQIGKDPKGPLTCRSILDAYAKEEDKSKLLAFAQDITSAWTPVEKLPHLQQVLQALQPAPALPVPAPAETDTPVTTAAATAQNPQQVQDELEAFLLSTAAAGGNNETAGDNDSEDDDHAYESDGGTRYVKDPFSDRWIHEALAPPKVESKEAPKAKPTASKADSASNNNKKNPNKKAKFSKRNARHWVYVTGLPASQEEIPMTELQKFFGKVGLLDLDPETMQPKIKLYRDAGGKLKGDASLCYARPESVELALQVLDESPWDEHHTIRVTRAKFEAKSDGTATSTTGKRQRRPVSEAQRKVARLALIQAQDEGFGVRLAGGRKGLRIVVVKHMLDGIPEADWETSIQAHCQELDAAVEKITCISKTKVVIIKFAEPTAAAQAVEAWNGKVMNIGSSSQAMEALYWDGVTDYTHQEHSPDEEEKRHEDFGKWLDNQGEDDLPPDLRLQVAEE